MKIRTKFIISLMLLVLLPALFTVFITNNFLSNTLSSVHFFDTYYDIFDNFSNVSREFEDYVSPYTSSPEYFLTDTFQNDAKEQFSNAFLIVEVSENQIIRYTTFSEEISNLSLIERWLFRSLSEQSPKIQYSLKHHHFQLASGNAIDVRLKIDSTRLDLAYQVFETVFFFLYGAFNLILLSVLLSWISNPIKRAIKRLTFTTNEIRKGNLRAKLTYDEQDDFQELADSIESMRYSLENSVEKQQVLEIEKKELIANISHDLRTPITSIRGYVQGLKDGVARTEETQREYLETIESKTYMIESLLNDLFEITRFDHGSIKLNKQVINLRDFLTDCVDELESDVTKVGGKLSLHYIIKETNIQIDPEKFMRVFINVIENSIKYRSSRPLEIVILANQDDDGVFINISDNGIGVNEEDLKRIFERFYRSDKSRNLDVMGSGIGLSICKEIIASHGGKISASSNDSNGLTISIRLQAFEKRSNQ
ncbi:MAG: HAMP domain-containing histidine kinase [Firmicutes bacterium]|nr:HAMP domain-containing histidine kinase [Bacillota bacterium]